MKTLIDFFYMGGDWGYVWSAYSITAIFMLANMLLPLRRRRKLLAQIKRKVDKGKNRK